jgi:hypothetical protein
MAFCPQQSLTYHQFSNWRQKFVSEKTAESQSSAGFATVIPTKMVGTESHEISSLAFSLPGGITITGVNADNVWY